ncbi:hypothetical protein WKR98_00105 [Pigmentiphaga sp. YJ18]|uniref:hypothetical protein n=1 Tax=Pigmentiphaga sp. YJ18 TaxID=3134907 RepID=UPI003112B1EA
MQNIERSTVFGSNSPEAVVIMGVSPAYRIAVKPGVVTPTTFQNSDWRVGEFNVRPENGYIVARVSANQPSEAHAIVQVLGEGLIGPAFRPCNGQDVITFQAKPGEVLYLGDFQYLISEKKLMFARSERLEQAQAYLKASYPQIAPDAKVAQLMSRTMTGYTCNQTLHLAIPVPR